jgi:hypothetical protein
MWSGDRRRNEENIHERMMITRDKPALAKAHVEQLTPQSDPAAVHQPHRIILAIAGKRYEFTLHTEVRKITRGPAKLIEMPGRSSIER